MSKYKHFPDIVHRQQQQQSLNCFLKMDYRQMPYIYILWYGIAIAGKY